MNPDDSPSTLDSLSTLEEIAWWMNENEPTGIQRIMSDWPPEPPHLTMSGRRGWSRVDFDSAGDFVGFAPGSFRFVGADVLKPKSMNPRSKVPANFRS